VVKEFGATSQGAFQSYEPWPVGFRIVEVIEACHGKYRVVATVGTISDDTNFVALEVYFEDSITGQSRAGFTSELAIAELVRMMEDGMSSYAAKNNATFSIIPVDPPFGRAEFEAAVGARAISQDLPTA